MHPRPNPRDARTSRNPPFFAGCKPIEMYTKLKTDVVASEERDTSSRETQATDRRPAGGRRRVGGINTAA